MSDLSGNPADNHKAKVGSEEDKMDPSELMGQLEDILDSSKPNGSFDSSEPNFGSFACATAFESAPNPLLLVNGVGHMGLPVPEREVNSISRVAMCWTKSAKSTVGDGVSVHGPGAHEGGMASGTIWEIGESDFSFLNLEFKDWVTAHAKKAAEKELVVGSNRIAEVELACPRLLLVGEGTYDSCYDESHMRPISANSFGMVLVMLPIFNDYEFSIAHPESGDTVRYSAHGIRESSKTGIVVWYNGVRSTAQGTFLAVAYDLVYTGKCALPSFVSQTFVLSELRRIVRCWIENRRSEEPVTPRSISWLLSKAYPRDMLPDAVQFDDADRSRLQHLQTVAAEEGLQVYLVNANYEQGGLYAHFEDRYPDEDYYMCGRYGYSHHGHDSKSDPESELYENGFHELEDVQIEQLVLTRWTDWKTKVQLPGLSAVEQKQIDEEWTDVIPAPRVGVEGPPNREFYKSGVPTLTHCWDYTAIVFWPRSENAAVAVEYFGYDVYKLLDPRMWPGSEDGRVAFVEDVLPKLKPVADIQEMNPTLTISGVMPPLPDQSTVIQECANAFLDLALQNKKPDLFLSVVQRLGVGGDDRLGKAIEVFEDNPETVERIVLVFIKQAPTLLQKLKLVSSVVRAEDPRRTTFIESALSGNHFSKSAVNAIPLPDMVEICTLLGEDMFVSRIVPNLCFKNTTYLTAFLANTSVQSEKLISCILPPLITAHQIDFSPSAPPAGPGRHTYAAPKPGPKWENAPGKQTRDLFDLCFKLKRVDQAGKLSSRFVTEAPPFANTRERKSFFSALFSFVTGNPKNRETALSSEPGFLYLCQHAILSNLVYLGIRPAPPLPGSDYEYPPLTCKACAACKHISAFLASPTQTILSFSVDFSGGKRQHYNMLFRAFPAHSLDVRMHQPCNAPEGTLTLTKLSSGVQHQKDVANWERRRQKTEKIIERVQDVLGSLATQFRIAVSPLGHGFDKSLEELVEFSIGLDETFAKGSGGSGGAGAVRGPSHARLQNSVLMEDNAQNVANMAPSPLPSPADAGPPAQGRKRKWPVDVIDLTEMDE